MKHGSLFSGIGGFDLAAHWAGIDTVFACEIDEWNREVLKKRFPNTTIYKDIKEVNFEQYRGTVDIISGGFPCQPFSLAGKRAGTKDDRYLWGEMFRVVREVEPTWVIAENVRGLTTIEGGSTFETVCDDLEVSGYEVQPFIIPALSVGAPHKRERVWIIAHTNDRSRSQQKVSARGSVYEMCDRGDISGNPPHSNSRRFERTKEERGQGEYALRSDFGVTRSITHPDSGKRLDIDRELQSPTETTSGKEQRQDRERMRGESRTDISEFATRNIKTTHPDSERLDRSIGKESTDCALHRGRQDWSEKWIEALARIYGMDDGLPGGMDRLDERYKDRSRMNRIKAMGNAIVPQVAYQIFSTIREVEGL